MESIFEVQRVVETRGLETVIGNILKAQATEILMDLMSCLGLISK